MKKYFTPELDLFTVPSVSVMVGNSDVHRSYKDVETDVGNEQ